MSSSATPCSGRAGDAAVVRVNDGPKALALTTDVTERPEIMGQLVGCIRGIAADCTALLVAKGLASQMARSDALMLCAHLLARASDRLRRR
jgi:hypothetical protein